MENNKMEFDKIMDRAKCWQVPNGISGNWKIETFTVSAEDAKRDALQGMFHGGRCCPAGTYQSLKRNNSIIMSNTPDEISDCRSFIVNATGSILINGLGLGMVLGAVLSKSDITHVTVIEISEDVIKLVAPTFTKDSRVEIINADAYTWKPPRGARYEMVWHDIWDNICSDNLEDMKRLRRKYCKRTKKQSCWCDIECMRAKMRYG